LTRIIDTDEWQINGAFPKVLRLYEQFLEEVFLTAEKYESLINLLVHKKNLILQGSPGVGKTFAALRLTARMVPDLR